MSHSEGAAVSMNLTVSAYERIAAKHRSERRLPCRRFHDGSACVLEPLHDDWHSDTHGRRWP